MVCLMAGGRVCVVLSLAGHVQGALGRLCARDKGDSSVFERSERLCVCL